MVVPSTYTALPLKSTAPHSLHLLLLLLTSVIIGITFVALSSTPTLAKKQATPLQQTFTTIPKANIVFADTVGAQITESPTTPTPPNTQPSHPLTSDELYAQNQTATAPAAPSEIPTPPTTTLNSDLIFSMINQIREQNGLSDFQKDDRLCTLASSRAPEIHHEVISGTMHQGMYARHLPYWNNENIIDIASEQEAVNWWMSDYVHKAAILGNYQFSCVACSGNACAEEFSNFDPK